MALFCSAFLRTVATLLLFQSVCGAIPSVEIRPRNVSILVDQTANFSCTVAKNSSYVFSSYQWKVNGDTVLSADSNGDEEHSQLEVLSYKAKSSDIRRSPITVQCTGQFTDKRLSSRPGLWIYSELANLTVTEIREISVFYSSNT